MKPIGRSLPRLVLATIASLATRHHVSVSSDRVETRRALLTGGLLVRVQPEEPNPSQAVTYIAESGPMSIRLHVGELHRGQRRPSH